MQNSPRVLSQLLKKGVPFVWDDITQKEFDALKHTLTHTSLLHPQIIVEITSYTLSASDSTIGMVLVQEDESHNEHVIYYLSRSLSPTKIKYSHVEKLALVVVQVVQRFRHYILL
jgi:hypothetical protein